MAEIPAGIRDALNAYERCMGEWVCAAGRDSDGFGGGPAAGRRATEARQHLHATIEAHMVGIIAAKQVD